MQTKIFADPWALREVVRLCMKSLVINPLIENYRVRERRVATLLLLLGTALSNTLVLAQEYRVQAQDAVPLTPESIFVEQLPIPGAHWLIVNDMNFVGLMDSKVYLVDADSGDMLGMLSTGGLHTAVEVAPDNSEIYAAETYYSRGTRGTRTDVISVYSRTNLAPIGEVVIPPKRASGMPHRAYTGLSDDGKFVYVANMTPATSVSIADVKSRVFVEEVATPGCTLIFPTGNREFGMLCGDGSFLLVQLDSNGHAVNKIRSPVFFDAESDPVTEKAVRYRNSWLFVSFDGEVHPVSVNGIDIDIEPVWSLLSAEDRKDRWKIGGLQHLAIHVEQGRLYSLMHQGGKDSHKQDGTEVWVYDLTNMQRLKRISLEAPAASIQVSQDQQALLYAVAPGVSALMIYDALSGEFKRKIEGAGFNPSLLQNFH